MQKRKRAMVIYSPTSGRAARLSEALTFLRDAQVDIVQVLPVYDPSLQTAQGQTWVEQGIDVVIGAGGDGVIGSVINHLVSSRLPLGIMPLGTSNDIVRSLGIPLDLGEAARTIAHGHTRLIDLGMVKSVGSIPPTGQASEEVIGYFAHVLTVGLNVQFAQIATNVAMRRRYGRLTYPVAALEAINHPKILDVQLRFEGLQFPKGSDKQQKAGRVDEIQEELRFQALQVTIVNAPIFGGAWQIALPGSTLDDDVLDIVIFEEVGLGKLSTHLASFFNSPPTDIAWSEEVDEARQFFCHPAELTSVPGIHHFQAQGLTLTTSQGPQPVTLDGEIRGKTPLHVTLARNVLPVLIPK